MKSVLFIFVLGFSTVAMADGVGNSTTGAVIKSGTYDMNSCAPVVDGDNKYDIKYSTKVEVESDSETAERLARPYGLDLPYVKSKGRSIRILTIAHLSEQGALEVPNLFAMDKDGSLSLVHASDCISESVKPSEVGKYWIYKLQCGGITSHYKIRSTLIFDKDSGKFVYSKIDHNEGGPRLGRFFLNHTKMVSEMACKDSSIDESVLAALQADEFRQAFGEASTLSPAVNQSIVKEPAPAAAPAPVPAPVAPVAADSAK